MCGVCLLHSKAVGLGGVGTILTTNGYFVSQSDNQFTRGTACDKIGVCGEAEYNLALRRDGSYIHKVNLVTGLKYQT